MGQHVERSSQHTFRARAALNAAFGMPIDADDLDGHTAAYDLLREPLNSSPAIIKSGDTRLGPLVVCFCQQCGARVAAAFLDDGRARGGSVVYHLMTQHPAAEQWREVPVVLSAPEDTERGRPALRCNPTAVTHCRAHGRLTVKTRPILQMARNAVALDDRGKPIRIQRVNAV